MASGLIDDNKGNIKNSIISDSQAKEMEQDKLTFLDRVDIDKINEQMVAEPIKSDNHTIDGSINIRAKKIRITDHNGRYITKSIDESIREIANECQEEYIKTHHLVDEPVIEDDNVEWED